jgi:hypothetical protein
MPLSEFTRGERDGERDDVGAVGRRTFTTLAERYESQAKDIYNRFAPSSDQLVVIKPNTSGVFGSRSRIKSDSRALPIVSLARDTRRVSKFLRSSEGILFLAKQTLLQTGNTFETTRVLNPFSFLLNVVPHTVRFKRHFDIPTRKESGFLQTNTIQKMSDPKFGIVSQLKGLASRFTNAPRGAKLNGLFNTPYLASNQILGGWGGQRPEFSAFSTRRAVFITGAAAPFYTGPKLYTREPLETRGTRRTPDASPTREVLTTWDEERLNYVKRFYTINGTSDRLRNPYLEPRPSVEPTGQKQTSNDIKNFPTGSTRIQDVYNLITRKDSGDSNVIDYTILNKRDEKSEDLIKFTFQHSTSRVVGSTVPPIIHFRAFLKRIKENVKTEFNEQRYVGRTERFVTYGGAKRSVDMEFNIVAFSDKEINGMWTKINYLSGLAFPKGVENGFMVPPLFKVSVGRIYDNQPCYLENLDYSFVEENTTFDIDAKVPFSISVTMRVSILEKRSKFYDSPFYKITEDLPTTSRDSQEQVQP